MLHDQPQLNSPEGYRLLELLGRGLSGRVWRAVAPGNIFVAIKHMHWAGEERMNRERDALKLVSPLRHPFILPPHAYWEQDRGLFLVTELADGSLRDRFNDCQRRGLQGIPTGELLRYVREAGEALDFLHAHHVLHRDIKPENILLLQGHAKVADFGLARQLRGGRGSVSGSGTPRYMAPEAWDGRLGGVRPSSDLYSLAVSYVELRLGHSLFAAEDMMGLMIAHLRQAPDLSGFEPPERRVLRKALAKAPAKRYPSCRAFVRALARAVAVGRACLAAGGPGGGGR
jgi:serine/threonine protein kinase